MPTNDQDISRALGRLEGKVDSVLQQIAATHNTLLRHDTRISTLENWRSSIKGSVLVVASIASVLASIVTAFIVKRL